MIEKREETIQANDLQLLVPDPKRTLPSLMPPILCAIVYTLCVLVMAAPLSRAYDPVLRLQLPLGSWLTQVGAWLPTNWGLSSITRDAQTNTDMVLFLGLVALAFVIYGLCALYISRLPAESTRYRHTMIVLWAGTTIVGLIFVFTPSMLSHDILVYASYSRLLAIYHANPYFVPLTAFPLDPYVPLNYWSGAISAYGPLWLGVCWLVGLVVGSQVAAYVLAFRLFALAVHLLNTWLVTRTLRVMGGSPRTITLGALLYAWNPLVLFESGLGGHNDVFMLTFILLGIFLAARAQQRVTLTSPRGYLPPLTAFTLAALVKFTALPVIALFLVFLAWNTLRAQGLLQWKKAIVTVVIASVVAAALALAFYAPFWIGHRIRDILNSFTSPPSALGSENSILRFLRSILSGSYDHSLTLNTLASWLIFIFSIRKVWDIINIVLLAIVGLFSAIRMWRSPATRAFTLASLAALGVLLIVTPWFFSWYVIWLVGLAAVALPVRESRIGSALLVSALTFSASAFFNYFFLSGNPPFGIWSGLVGPATITPPLLAFVIAYLLWQPANDLRHSASENVVH